MTDVSGPGRAVVAMALAAALLVACSDGSPEADPPAPTPGSPTTAAAPAEDGPTAPPDPATDDPARLAGQIDRAAATLRAGDAEKAAVRRAAEFLQLAARSLAQAPAGLRREVLGRLDRPTAREVRADVTAARLLMSMLTEPAEELPRWRIVRPPPARELLGHYRDAQRRTGVHWSHLAAIHLVETRMGRIRGVSTAGAQGPMQFLPSTWDIYGAGGDIHDPGDAILAAARLLAAHGAPGDPAGALWHYNPSDAYVGAVLAYARTMRRSPDAYHRYWHWRVLYTHRRGTHVLPVGYPEERPVLLTER